MGFRKLPAGGEPDKRLTRSGAGRDQVGAGYGCGWPKSQRGMAGAGKAPAGTGLQVSGMSETWARKAALSLIAPYQRSTLA
jgi:hypothetical protein